MSIGIVSDTHGSLACWQKLSASLFSSAEHIIHAGDVLYHGPRNPHPAGYAPMELAQAIIDTPIPVSIVRGNCDAEVDEMVLERELPREVVLTADSLQILVVHGHRGKLAQLARRYKADLVVSGHTHIPGLSREAGAVYANPGSPALPKGGNPPTAIVLEGRRLTLVDLAADKTLATIDI